MVKVIGGAPPIGAGPKQLNFTKGEKVRFEIDTNEPFTFEIKGLGVTQSIEESSIVSFKATKAGQFPVISTTTLIGVADLLIKKKYSAPAPSPRPRPLRQRQGSDTGRSSGPWNLSAA